MRTMTVLSIALTGCIAAALVAPLFAAVEAPANPAILAPAIKVKSGKVKVKLGRLQLRTLPPAPKGGRFKMNYDRVWPAEAGQAHVCLWADDKYAAASITIDDNCQPDHAWWIEQGNKHGFRFTWFVVTGGMGEKGRGFFGTWPDFQKLQELGHDVHSHTVSHHSDDAKRSDDEVHHQYRDSKKAIKENVPGARADCMAYPYGSGKDAIAEEYYIACRGVVGGPNLANSVNYMRTKSLTINRDSVDMILTGKHASVAWLNRATNRRGWLTPVYHYVHAGHNKEEQAANAKKTADGLAYLASKKDEVWVGLFRDVACYGMERDTAKVNVTANTAQEIRLTLSDDMDDTLYAYPLTLKVRLRDTWKAVAATQAVKPIEARVVEHEGARFALVNAVPDKGEVRLTPAPEVKKAEADK